MICSMMASQNLFKVLMLYMMFLMMLSMGLFQMLTMMCVLTTEDFLKHTQIYAFSVHGGPNE